MSSETMATDLSTLLLGACHFRETPTSARRCARAPSPSLLRSDCGRSQAESANIFPCSLHSCRCPPLSALSYTVCRQDSLLCEAQQTRCLPRTANLGTRQSFVVLPILRCETGQVSEFIGKSKTASRACGNQRRYMTSRTIYGEVVNRLQVQPEFRTRAQSPG